MKCLVIGLGKSGLAAALALSKENEVTVLEEVKSQENIEKAKQLEQKNLRVVFNLNDSSGFDLIVPSPGVPYHHKLLKNADGRVISEVELGYLLNPPAKLLGVTGTNGKTTTVSMLKAIYKMSGKKYKIAGNIGNPYVELENKPLAGTSLILELSSFQLHFTDKFRADIAVILNVTEDHLDWHIDFQSYVADKRRILNNQTKNDIAILNIDDAVTAGLLGETLGQVITVSARANADYCLRGDSLCFEGRPFMGVSDLKLPGSHNLINALSACAAASADGIPLETCREALKGYKGLPHRLEKVAKVNGRFFINDSKSTNPEATVKALESMEKPVVLLTGGRNKGNSFANIPPRKISKLICFGQAAGEIFEQISARIKKQVPTLYEAVRVAYKESQSGDTILLSPGCASFDEFNDYKDRGKHFKQYVQEVANERS